MSLPDEIKKAMVAESVRVENRHSFIEGAEWMYTRLRGALKALEDISNLGNDIDKKHLEEVVFWDDIERALTLSSDMSNLARLALEEMRK